MKGYIYGTKERGKKDLIKERKNIEKLIFINIFIAFICTLILGERFIIGSNFIWLFNGMRGSGIITETKKYEYIW